MSFVIHKNLPPAINQNYEIKKQLGEGGFAVVFLAIDLRNKTPVALKIINKNKLVTK
jgi:serine/threonine protein kinase